MVDGGQVDGGQVLTVDTRPAGGGDGGQVLTVDTRPAGGGVNCQDLTPLVMQVITTFQFLARPIHRMLVKLIMCLSMTVATAAGATEAFLNDAIHELGFETTHKADLAAGKIISVGLPNLERQPTELMVGAAMMLVRRPLVAVSQALLGDDTFRVNTKILDFRAIGDGNASREEIDKAFRSVGYS